MIRPIFGYLLLRGRTPICPSWYEHLWDSSNTPFSRGALSHDSRRSFSQAQAVLWATCRHASLVSSSRCCVAAAFQQTSSRSAEAWGVRFLWTYSVQCGLRDECKYLCLLDSQTTQPSRRQGSPLHVPIYLCWTARHASSPRIGSRLQFVCSGLVCRAVLADSDKPLALWMTGKRTVPASCLKRRRVFFIFDESWENWKVCQASPRSGSP